MSEQQRPMVIPAEQADRMGLLDDGIVGFVVDSAKATWEKSKKTGDEYMQVKVQVTINQRPGRKDVKEKHFETFRLIGGFFRQFRNFYTALGVRPQQGADLNIQEIAKAIQGRSAFGTITTDSYTDRDGQPAKTSKFGNRFAKTMGDLQAA